MEQVRGIPSRSGAISFLIGGTAHAHSPHVQPANQGLLILAIFIVTQVLDGSLTYWGVSRFGIGIEMNGWLATTMQAFGTGTALIAAKALACFCGCLLYLTSSLRPLAVASGLCIGVAVGPWIFVLLTHGL